MAKKDYTNAELLSYVEHTYLKPFASWKDIKRLCEQALEYKTAAVCVPPTYVKHITEKFGDKINICTVVGFAQGYSVKDVKVFEAKKAIEDGADEIDMVVNITDIKNKDFDKVEDEIKAVKTACGDKILKVIVEVCYLTRPEKIRVCECITNAGADYIKTSTGFGTAGATLDDIELFKAHLGPNVKIKASGGLKTREALIDYIEAGCERIGSSSAVELLSKDMD